MSYGQILCASEMSSLRSERRERKGTGFGPPDSVAPAPPVPVLIAKRSPYCVITIAAVRVSGMLAEATNCVNGGKL